MKAAGKYVQQLETDVKFLRELLAQAHKDVEFYRGKVERLELAIMSNAAAPAQIDYAHRTETRTANSVEQMRQQSAPRLPFSEIKRRCNQLSAEDQEKAMADGWNLDEQKEATKAGS